MSQLKSKERVRDHGEVFTHEREVNAMLDLVKHETERIESRFLEPACGTGNFLVPVLERKLALVKRKYGRSQTEFERYAILAVASVYGIDLLADNVLTCKERLFVVFNETYTSLYKSRSKDALRESVRFVLDRNILVGNALTLKTEGKSPQPILFSAWSLVRGSMFKQHDYTFEELLPSTDSGNDLFKKQVYSDQGKPVFLPRSTKEYPLTHVLQLATTYENTH